MMPVCKASAASTGQEFVDVVSLGISLLSVLLAASWGLLAVVVMYLLGLAAAASLPRRKVPPASHLRTFRVVVPAHNEALVLAPVLRRFMNVRYPSANYEVVVVADNCSDHTADVARECGVRVLERFDQDERGKGHALAFAFDRLRDEVFDAYVVLDADTLVEPDLLDVFNRYLHAGHRVIQGFHDVLNPFETQRTALMYVAFNIFHYVRPLGRRALGLSVGLNGNGMCFAKDVIDRYPWHAFSLAEDIEQTTTLVLNHERIVFAPEARIVAQMVGTGTQATSQRLRWETGRLQMARQHGLRLLVEGVRRRSLRIFDWGMDLLIPPLAALSLALISGTLLSAVIALIGGTRLMAALGWAWAGLLAALALFVVVTMIVGHLPGQAYQALLNAPRYVLWKLWLYALIALGRTPRDWVRTERTPIVEE
jgi:1,2-diacylglycerol 3-beta-glucosyltransferase